MPVEYSDLSNRSKYYKNASEAIEYAQSSLDRIMSGRSPKGDIDPYNLLEMECNLPYVIHETKTPNTFILVNRQYKPVGSNHPTGGKWEIYKDFANLHVKLTSEQLNLVVYPGGSNVLFVDGFSPWHNNKTAKAYLKRLKTLNQLLL